MKLNREQVQKVAKLANLPLTSDEEELYAEQLSAILEYVDSLEKVDTSNIEPTFNVTVNKNVLAEDIAVDSLSTEQALQNAKNAKDGFFVTKGVFNQD